MKPHKKSLYDSKILTGFLLLVLVKPEYFTEIGWLDTIYNYTSLAIAMILVIVSLISKPIHKSRIWIIAFYSVMLFMTIFGSGNVLEYMKANFASLALCLMFDIWLEKSPKTLIEGFNILEVLVYANLITVLLFPKGMYRTELYTANWLLGYKNYHIRTILPIVCIALIRSYWKWGKVSLRTWFLIVCSAVTMILIDSSTALVGYVVFIGLLMLYHSKKKALPQKFTLSNMLLATVFVFIAIILFNVQESFSYLIESVLGRNLSFTGRLPIWGISAQFFLKKPIFGYGFLTGDDYVKMFNAGPWFAHPHNYMFYILLTGGLMLGIIVIIGYSMASRTISKNIKSVYSKIILFTLCSFLVMGIAEAITSTVLLYPMLVLGMNIDKIAALGYLERRKAMLKIGRRIIQI